ncbi:MAG: DUF167 domain-containing protein [Candidatus Acididesulfobacter diazotrophicus]|jgi:hypothetical protein|uniref:UPF0235 protein EVG15_08515 n=1 Tax=Candidatus Acididesulfobacter diazotrophicus TaxID=2597226 RepID=A0A519BKY3_9DELT|nr:MAG: DUF167 domain-containing protein [Candidatus Acididesulfobacter diazotrophicus]
MSEIIEIEVKTGSKLKKFEISEKAGGKKIKLYIPERPVDNKANEAVIKYLSEILNIPKKNIEIIKGLKVKNKLVHILGRVIMAVRMRNM